MRVSVIFSTYNQPSWLEKCLWGFACQTRLPDEVLVADDGSTRQTKDLLDQLAPTLPFPIKHIWQPDEGFQKCRILNKAAAQASGEYLIFTDGDCIARNDFVAQHLRLAKPGQFLSGGDFKLPLSTSQFITRAHVESQEAFRPKWLTRHGVGPGLRMLKLLRTRWAADVLNWLVPTRPSFNGHNSSCFASDLRAVNGFDENMQYGGEDLEFGLRLVHAGFRAKRMRFSTTCLHLEHGRGYVKPEMLEKNRLIRQQTIVDRRIRVPNGQGIDQYLEPSGAPGR